jgi:hypothetical protein
MRPYEHRFGATGEPGTCRWCGRVLRFKAHMFDWPAGQPEPVLPEGARVTRRRVPGRFLHGSVDYVLEGQPGGDYRDGHFCGLRCGYAFAVRLADLGARLTTSGGSVTTRAERSTP